MYHHGYKKVAQGNSTEKNKVTCNLESEVMGGGGGDEIKIEGQANISPVA